MWPILGAAPHIEQSVILLELGCESQPDFGEVIKFNTHVLPSVVAPGWPPVIFPLLPSDVEAPSLAFCCSVILPSEGLPSWADLPCAGRLPSEPSADLPAAPWGCALDWPGRSSIAFGLAPGVPISGAAPGVSNPLRGSQGLSPEAFQLVYEQVMSGLMRVMGGMTGFASLDRDKGRAFRGQTYWYARLELGRRARPEPLRRELFLASRNGKVIFPSWLGLERCS
jgi:hypothetical protein